ncbi:MAG TPA: Ig-like domain-containing protein [Nitrospirota bacterium]|nr:Ig-like domain-containing protein [Nitrospirota bacterium]
MGTLKNIRIALALIAIVAAAFSCVGHSGKLAVIEVTPSETRMTEGATQQLLATAIFTDGSSLNWTSAATWVSSDPSVATVGNVIGTFGLVTATSFTTGFITIQAIDVVNNVSGSATLIVTHTPLIAITVQQALPILAILPTGTTKQFTATGVYADSSEQHDLTDLVSWSSSNPAVATVSDSSGSQGIVTAIGAGSAIITAIDSGTNISGFTIVNVQ